MIVELPIRSVRVDGELQPRDHVNEDVAKRYAETMMEGLWDYAKSSSPIIVFHDGTDHWLADGFHRVIAAQLAGWSEIEVKRRTGTQRDAKWFSFSANTAHGYPRGRSDVQRILKAIFTDEDWSQTPLREIARHIGVRSLQRGITISVYLRNLRR